MRINKYLLFFILNIPFSVYAASCGGIYMPTIHDVETADIIFKGKMIHEYHDNNDGLMHYQFGVDELWKGNVDDNQITITEEQVIHSFPVFFTKNWEFIVYAYKREGKIISSSCSSYPVHYLNNSANIINGLGQSNLAMPTHEKSLDSLLNQLENNSTAVREEIIADILKVEKINFDYENDNLEVLSVDLNKGLSDGLFLGKYMYFHWSHYFYHSIIITELQNKSSKAIYFCWNDGERCNSAKISKISGGNKVYSNQNKLKKD